MPAHLPDALLAIWAHGCTHARNAFCTGRTADQPRHYPLKGNPPIHEAVIVDCVRLPQDAASPAGHTHSPESTADLLATALQALVQRTGLDPELVDDVILGAVSQAGDQGYNVARTGTPWSPDFLSRCPRRRSTVSVARVSSPPTSRRSPSWPGERRRDRLRRREHEPGAHGCERSRR